MGSLAEMGILILVYLTLIDFIYSAEISFCDGHEKKIRRSREQCSSGFNFGEQRPECICLKGIYRFWTESCEVADGFAEEICTNLRDSSSGSNIMAMKMTKDPVDWTHTGVVCEKKSYGTDVWDYISESSRSIITKSNSIYVINGKAFWEPRGARGTICVRHASLPEKESICKYNKKDNLQTWKQAEVRVEIKKECSGTPLKKDHCFGVLKKKDSECELSCTSGRAGYGRNMGLSPSKSADLGSFNRPMQILPLLAGNDNYTNPADYRRHDNKFLNRKMLIYNIISQIDEATSNSSNDSSNPPPVPYGAPKKTFELFHIMKGITQKFCPDEYVSMEWIDLAVNLFYILHKGNVFLYEEVLSQEEYEWIKSILTTCIEDTRPVQLVSRPNGTDPHPPHCDGGKATGYCNGTNAQGKCNYKPVYVYADKANDSFHYVPDVAWDIIDLVQVACFGSFNASYRMFHVLEQAAEKLFTIQIKNLWYYPGWSKKTKHKLLGAAADTQMHNLEVCVESAYNMNGRIPRLVRPVTPRYLRKKRSVSNQESIAKESQVYCSRTTKEFSLPRGCSVHH